jgi:hypothetical protein
MSRKQIILVVVIVIAASSLSALVAYRSARRQSLSLSAAGVGKTTCVDFRDADSRAGETGCVAGQVVRVFTSHGGNTFLDFCADYRSCPFTSVVFSSDRRKFGDLSALAGRRIEIHGPITTYNGRAEIIIREPQQIGEAGDR